MTSAQMVQHIVSKVIPTMQIDLHRGRHELPDGSHYNVDEYISKPPQDCPFESHRRFIDIQYLVEGEELIYTADIDGLTPSTAYDETRDIILYQDTPTAQRVHLKAGEFRIFYPQDAHKASIRVDESGCAVKKVVFKVRIDA